MLVRIRIGSVFSQQQAGSGSQKIPGFWSGLNEYGRDPIHPKHRFKVDLTFGQICLVWTVLLKIFLGMFHSYLIFQV